MDPEFQKPDSSFRLVAVLTAVCAVSALAVAAVSRVTEKPIQEGEARRKAAQIRAVLPPGSPEPVERACLAPDGSTNFLYFAAGDAVAIEAESANGYGGKLRLLAGFDAAGTLYNFRVLEHSETQGLGARLADDGNEVLSSAKGRPAAGTRWAVEKDGGDIAALTAATISSRAACEALAEAAKRLDAIRAASHRVP